MRFRNRTALLASAGLLAVAGAGAAIGVAATSTGGSPSEAFAAALSDRVGTDITPEQVEQARQDVLKERLNEAVQQGRLTQEQADHIQERLEQAPERRAQRMESRAAVTEAIGGFLGLSPEELREQRTEGKSLAGIAKDQGKTRAGLLDAVKGAIREGAQAAGVDPPTAEDLDRMAERIVDGTRLHGGGPGGFHGGGPGGFHGGGPGGFHGGGPGGPGPGGP